jgi:hypothetical protein
MAAIWVSPEAALGIDVQPHGDAAAFEAEHGLAVLHARRADAARTEDAAVMIEIDVRMRGVDLAPRPLIGLGRRHHAEAVAQRLQLAIPARHAIGAGMIAFDEQHFDDGAPIVGELRRVVLDHHAVDAGVTQAAPLRPLILQVQTRQLPEGSRSGWWQRRGM